MSNDRYKKNLRAEVAERELLERKLDAANENWADTTLALQRSESALAVATATAEAKSKELEAVYAARDQLAAGYDPNLVNK